MRDNEVNVTRRQDNFGTSTRTSIKRWDIDKRRVIQIDEQANTPEKSELMKSCEDSVFKKKPLPKNCSSHFHVIVDMYFEVKAVNIAGYLKILTMHPSGGCFFSMCANTGMPFFHSINHFWLNGKNDTARIYLEIK